jgi:Fic family protein
MEAGQQSGQTRGQDRQEHVAIMEPLLINEGSRFRRDLTDLTLDLASKSARFKASLPSGLVDPLARAVRTMNCYYSNLIEGHDTHPVDIERAMKRDYSADRAKRDLQFEARAHIEVQQWLDEANLAEKIFSAGLAAEIHRRFCALLPEDLLWVEDPASGDRLKVEPGKWREHDVKVGNHVAISPGAVPRFMQRFEEVFGRAGRADAIIATASAHHRLLWIHPFLDGNGRVARLMSHAQMRHLAESGGLWSVARGLARSVVSYKQLLANCDLRRRNDLDGRGNLSEEALAEFTRFFLSTSIDQVTFMEALMQPERLRARVLLWAEEEIRLGRLPPRANTLLEHALLRGTLTRSDVVSLLGVSERSARRVTSALLDAGVLTSDSPKASLKLAFPASLTSRWMPGLFPEQTH